MRNFSGLLCGLLFGAGLTLSGMTDRQKVLGFLDILGQWDATLIFVMGGALLLSAPAYFLVLRRSRPIFEVKYFLPEAKNITFQLVLGAALFGLGWGLYGLCPGPAIAGLAHGNITTAYFVGAMLAGIALARMVLIRLFD